MRQIYYDDQGWDRGPTADPPGPPHRARRRSLRGVWAFLALLALLLGLTGLGAYLRGGAASPADRLPDLGDAWGLWDDQDYYGDDWLEDLGDTTTERAPTGDGTVLTLVPAEGAALSAQAIYEMVSPAVVGVRASLEDGMALGTGIVMSEDGYIITNAHVIAGSRRLTVTLSDDSREEALLVGYDGETDLAVLKIDARDLPVAEFGDSSALRVGDAAYAIGNPLGEELRGTMTDGIISAIDRVVATDGGEMTLLQTTAALNSGNSGGALVNAAGQVVGVTNMKMMSDWETIEGLGFAIPTVQAKEVVDQLIARGWYAGVPVLGITVSDQRAGADGPEGAYVKRVERGSDAYAQGVRAGDVIVEANGRTVASVRDLEAAKEGLKAGDEMALTLWNSRGARRVTVRLMGRNELDGYAP